MTFHRDPDDGTPVSPLYPNSDVLHVFGELAFLSFYSDHYGTWTAQDMARAFEAPVYLQQFHVYRARSVPRAMVTWALLDEAAEEKYLSTGRLERFEEWQSGDQLWIMALMAPWGHAPDVIKDLKATVQTNSVKTLRCVNGRNRVINWHRDTEDSRWKIQATPI